MAFLGFLALLAIGGGLAVGGIFSIAAANMVGSVHRSDRVFGWVLLVIGSALLYAAYKHAPFSIELHSAAITAQGGKA